MPEKPIQNRYSIEFRQSGWQEFWQLNLRPTRWQRKAALQAPTLPGKGQDIIQDSKDHLVALQTRIVQLRDTWVGWILWPQRLIFWITCSGHTGA